MLKFSISSEVLSVFENLVLNLRLVDDIVEVFWGLVLQSLRFLWFFKKNLDANINRSC